MSSNASTHRWRRMGAALPLMLVLTACAEDCADDQVAMGVARLTVQNADGALNAVLNDTTCGFASDQAVVTVEGNMGEQGAAVTTIENCTLEFPEATVVDEICSTGVQTLVYGKFTVIRATQTIYGLVLDPTGADPVLPRGDDAAVIQAEITFEGFTARRTDREEHLYWESGSLSGSVSPRLSYAGALAVCLIPTNNQSFWDVAYGPSNMRIETPEVTLPVQVDGSNLWGVDGLNRIPDRGDEPFENHIAGEITVWGTTHQLPIEDLDGKTGLDPDYSAEEFRARDECIEGIRVPVAPTCPPE